MDIAQGKTCTKCHQTKPVIDFNKKRRSKDGYRPECRYCQHEDSKIAKPVRKARDAKKKAELKTYCAQYHSDHREAILVRQARNRVKNHAKLLIDMKTYRTNNPDIMREGARRRRAREAGAPVNDLSPAQWQEIQVAQKHRCYYCQKRCKGKLTQDHILAISKGGSHTVHNVIAACLSCNSKKSANSAPVPVQPFLLTVAPIRKHYRPRSN